MARKRKSSKNLRKENDVTTALFANKLLAIFQSSYKNSPNNQGKAKNKGGEKKEQANKKQRPKISKRSFDGIKCELKFFIAFYGIGTQHRELSNQPKLSREQILIMDIDFDGLYFTPAPEDLSEKYREQKTKAAPYKLEHYPHSPSDYDLNQIPIWQEMKKFNSFRNMYRPICKQLAKIEYPPTDLAKLQLADMLDILSTHNRENPSARMTCQRSRFLKMFAACYGDEFIEKMTIMGKNKDAQNFMEYIRFLDNPSKKISPEIRQAAELFNVHHVKNRKHAEELNDYSTVSDFSNLALCGVFPYHKILHYPYEIDLNPNIIFFNSFLGELQITRNPEKERRYLQSLKHPSSQKQETR